MCVAHAVASECLLAPFEFLSVWYDVSTVFTVVPVGFLQLIGCARGSVLLYDQQHSHDGSGVFDVGEVLRESSL